MEGGLLSPDREGWWRDGRRPAAVSRSRRMWMEEGGRRRGWLARTHQKSFTVSVREDWYGLGQAPLRDGCVEERMAAVEGVSKVSVTGLPVAGRPSSLKTLPQRLFLRLMSSPTAPSSFDERLGSRSGVEHGGSAPLHSTENGFNSGKKYSELGTGCRVQFN